MILKLVQQLNKCRDLEIWITDGMQDVLVKLYNVRTGRVLLLHALILLPQRPSKSLLCTYTWLVLSVLTVPFQKGGHEGGPRPHKQVIHVSKADAVNHQLHVWS